MTHCYTAFTETDALLGDRGGGHVASWMIDSADVVSRGGKGDVTPRCIALAEKDRLIGACGGHDPAHWKNTVAETIAGGVRDNAAFLESSHSIGKPVSSGGHAPAHWMSNSSEPLASRSSTMLIEGRCDEWILCCALLRAASAVLEHVLRHDSGWAFSEIKNSGSVGNAEEVRSAKCMAIELNGALERFLGQSEVCLKHRSPTHCRAFALSFHAQTPGPVAA